MDLDITYVPTAGERRDAVRRSWFVRMLYGGLVGAVLAIFGIGSLSRAAARHGEAVGVASSAAVGGVLLLFLPLLINFWLLNARRHDQAERHVKLSSTGIRMDVQGVAIEVGWDRVTNFRETPRHWTFGADNICLVLPKRAVPRERAAQLEEFLRATL
jgi:YcxB-like protein